MTSGRSRLNRTGNHARIRHRRVLKAIARWSQQDRLDEVVELRAPELGTAADHARNRWMVDRSEFVIGFPRGTNPASGTWYTLSYTADQRKPRLVVPL